MSIGDEFVIICAASISDKKERKRVLRHLRDSGLEVILITEEQMHQFAGNVLEVIGKDDQHFLVISETAFKSFREDQLRSIKKYATILPIAVPTIELCGGGSVRCMLAEVFLPEAD